MNQKRFFALLTAAAMTVMLAACGGGNGDSANEITVVSREDGSGTRGAFTELMEVTVKDASGNKTDMTTADAIITNKTDVMLSTVAGDPAAIGYVSLGSLNDQVKALSIEGVAATPENVKQGTYKVVRPFNIATKGDPTGVARDFIRFILSSDGQAVVASGYISAVSNAPAFETDGSAGKIVVGGSSSVAPLMEKLIEAYQTINGAGEIELQTSDSTSGMTGTMDGTFDIGMASRALGQDEAAQLTATVIALDGIAVIVNNENPFDGLTMAQVRMVYTGEITDWSELE